MTPTWSVLFDDDEELGELLDSVFSAGLVGRRAALGMRRRAAAVATVMGKNGQGPQGKKLKGTPFSWVDHVMRLSESQFKRRYRLSWPSFNKLLRLLDDDLKVVSPKQAMRGNNGCLVPNAVKLAIGLRYLAGGDPLDLFLIYHVSLGYVYKCVWAVVDAVNRRLQIKFPIDEPEKLAQLEAEFRAASVGGIWEGQVGALDGVHFATIAPTAKDVDDPMRYHVARKDEYALLCMAVCDAQRRFLDYDISQVPQTHDSLAWYMSTLGRRVGDGELPAPYFISGDSAFSFSPSLICPSTLPEHDDFDYHQSSNRMPIECAFGILVQRWGILWRPLRCRFDRRAPLIGACMRLHNFCIDERVVEETVIEHGCGEVQPNRWEPAPLFDRYGRPVHHLDIEKEDAVRVRERRRQAGKNARLLQLVQLVRASGIKRPALAPGKRKKVRGRRGVRRVHG